MTRYVINKNKLDSLEGRAKELQRPSQYLGVVNTSRIIHCF